MFFLATADDKGKPTCSYKGGDPGFVRVMDEHTLAFPNYDGNGMYLSMGNVLNNPHVGLLFIDLEEGNRLRVNGEASISHHDPLLAEYPEAQFIVRVRASHVFPNCPRYIHHYKLVQRSNFVPKKGCKTPTQNGSVPTGQEMYSLPVTLQRGNRNHRRVRLLENIPVQSMQAAHDWLVAYLSTNFLPDFPLSLQ